MLKNSDLDHVVAVVIRFYGGVKLGTGMYIVEELVKDTKNECIYILQ